VRVHLCGVRGSTPAPGAEFLRHGGHTSCVALEHDDDAAPTLILDAGTGIRAVSELLHGQPFAGTILLTHLHWDHVQGLPFFAAADRDGARTTLLLPEQDDGSSALAVLERAMSPPHFPMSPAELEGDWDFATIAPGERRCAGFSVLAREIPHKGGRTFGYRISDGRATLAYMPDHCPTALGPGPDGNGEHHAAALELTADADLLIHDAQIFPGELAADARFGHAVSDYSIALARHAGTRSLLLFHHRPDRTDATLTELSASLPGEGPRAAVAQQGAVLQL
jgi:phosphoribosyl 1,2-cyclic phosphodiesterase